VVLARDEAVVMDMEAGLEHLGRGTSMYVDRLIVVVEPGRRSVETAYQIRRLADDIGLDKLSFVGNKLRSEKDKDFCIKRNEGFLIFGIYALTGRKSAMRTAMADLPLKKMRKPSQKLLQCSRN
jgi:CO dehydrogenase maturation factor